MAEARRVSRQVRRAQARRDQAAPRARTALRIDLFAVPLLLIAGFVAYHNALNGPFVLDDFSAIQRTELLMGLFFLVTLYGALRSFQSPKPRLWYAASLCAFALGLASKEVIVVAAPIVFLFDWLFDSPSLRAAAKRHFLLYAGYVGVVILYLLVVGTRLRWVLEGRGSRAITPPPHALTETGIIIHYLRLALWPDALAADYAGWPVANSVASVLPS